MAKRRYRSVPVKSFDWSGLCAKCVDKRVIVGVDVAKVDQFAAVMLPDLTVLVTVRWQQPYEQQFFVGFVGDLAEHAADVAVVMEPSGVYGDTIRHAVLEQGVEVYRVSPKRAHDAAEVYDGVPSRHDAKAAAIIAKLHIDGASEKWPMRTDHERRLHAKLRVLAVYSKEYKRNRDRLESLLSRYWPELPHHLVLGSATMLELLQVYPDPVLLAQASADATALMKRVGGRFLDESKVQAVVRCSRSTVGVPMLDGESELIQVVAVEARRHQQLVRRVERDIAALVGENEVTRSMQAMVGKTTAAVLVAAVGSPTRYHSAAAYQKAFGLNLKEQTSGTKKGGLHLTKRGPGIARLFLYMAALRFIQRDRVVRAWYGRKVRRQGGNAKVKAVVAVMRKLSLALWHVGQGAEFDAAKLFDVSRLNLDGEVAM